MTPIVFLPGMMCDARLFGPQIAALSANRTLHFPPLSGHDDFETLAAEILANAPPRFALAGLSMGGIVAMEIICQAPNRVERIAVGICVGEAKMAATDDPIFLGIRGPGGIFS